MPTLLGFAAELEAERDHVVRALDRDPEAELEEAQRERKTQDDLEVAGRSIEVLKASATFDRVLFDGGEFGTATEAGSPEEEDYLGLPGLLEPDQVATLLRKRQAAQLAARSAATAATEERPGGRWPVRRARASPRPPGSPAEAPKAPAVSREQLAALRKELNGLVGAWSHRTGQPHGVIHNELRSCLRRSRPPAGVGRTDQGTDRQDPPVGPVPPLTWVFNQANPLTRADAGTGSK